MLINAYHQLDLKSRLIGASMSLALLPIPFIFIRHGETDWNRTNRTMGQTDIPLNSLGIQQAREATQYLENLGVERIIHSPLSRAAQTATIINE
jgi:broad specificity phosphatase PhoE